MHTISVSTPAPAAPVLPVPTQQERFIRLPEVMHLCGLSRSTIYDLISRDAFPQQISPVEKMLPGTVGGQCMDGGANCSPRARRPCVNLALQSHLFFVACVLATFPVIVFPLPQNRQPGFAARVTYWRHSTRRACFFMSLLRHTYFSGCGAYTVAPVR